MVQAEWISFAMDLRIEREGEEMSDISIVGIVVNDLEREGGRTFR